MPKYNSEKTKKLKPIDDFLRVLFSLKKKKTYPIVVQEEVNEILILGTFLIGDTIMALPSLSILKKNFPNAKISMICGKAEETILKEQNLINKFIYAKSPWLNNDYTFKNIGGFISSVRTANQTKYDLCIDFRGDWRNIFVMNFINSKRKISYNFTGGEYFLTDAILPNKDISHFIEESLFLLKQIGCTFEESDKIPTLKLSDTDKEYIEVFKAKNGLKNKILIGVHPGASQEVKKWNEKKYIELICRLSKKLVAQHTFIIFEGPNERATVEIIENILTELNINFLIVNEKLHEYISILSICQLVICNDSGAAHIASAFAIPTVVIFGNVDPTFASPYGSKMLRIISHNLDCKPCHQSFCKFGTNLCISDISTEEVYTETIKVLEYI